MTAFNAGAAAASAAALNGGSLQLLSEAGTVLATIPAGSPTSVGAVTTMGGFPKTVNALATGMPASARYRTSAGVDWKTGMSVGVEGSGAQIILGTLDLVAGQPVAFSSATLTHTGTAA